MDLTPLATTLSTLFPTATATVIRTPGFATSRVIELETEDAAYWVYETGTGAWFTSAVQPTCSADIFSVDATALGVVHALEIALAQDVAEFVG